MSYTKCHRCGEYDDAMRHKCKPLWAVWCPEDGEDEEGASNVRARDAEEAAERWADDRDSGNEYYILAGACPLVCVRDGSQVRQFTISGESVPTYTASEKS